MNTKNAVETAKRVLAIEAEAIRALIGKLDGEFGKAVEMICSSAGRVVVCGMGKSGIIGQKIASTLASTGTPAFFLHPAEGVHGDIGMLMKNDVLIAISNSGETEELIKIIPIVKRMGVKMIAMTGRKESALGRHGDVVLDVGVAEEACPMGLAPAASATAGPRPRCSGTPAGDTIIGRRGERGGGKGGVGRGARLWVVVGGGVGRGAKKKA